METANADSLGLASVSREVDGMYGHRLWKRLGYRRFAQTLFSQRGAETKCAKSASFFVTLLY